MNEKQLDNKVRKDVNRIKEDLNTLADDSAARLGQFEENVSQSASKAKENLTIMVEDGVLRVSKGFGKLTGDAKESLIGAAATVKKEVENGMSQYNDRVQEVADKIPGSFSNWVKRYPWIAISITLAAGFLVGSFLKPARRPSGSR